MVVLGKHGFNLMGTRSVAEVVEQGKEFEGTLLVGVKMLNVGGLACACKHAEGVFETRVLSPWENQVVQSQLPTMPQPLK